MSYSPIGLTNIHCKIFERMTNKREWKTAAIFFNIKKIYDKIKRKTIFELLENMGIQE